MDRSHCIAEWELKHLPFSVTNGEIGVNGKVNRSVIIQRYSSHIARMFKMEYTVRKPSRELTYIEEEEEEKIPEVKVTNTKRKVLRETDKSENKSDAIKNVTIVNLEHKDDPEEVADDDTVVVTKDSHDRHVRFTSKVEEIDFKETDDINEKTS